MESHYICTGLPEPSLLQNVIIPKSHVLTYVMLQSFVCFIFQTQLPMHHTTYQYKLIYFLEWLNGYQPIAVLPSIILSGKLVTKWLNGYQPIAVLPSIILSGKLVTKWLNGYQPIAVLPSIILSGKLVTVDVLKISTLVAGQTCLDKQCRPRRSSSMFAVLIIIL